MGHNWGSFPQLVHRVVTCGRHEGIGCRLKAGASVESPANERAAATSKRLGCGSKSLAAVQWCNVADELATKLRC